jgi:peroxiredoxin Q/BCP
MSLTKRIIIGVAAAGIALGGVLLFTAQSNADSTLAVGDQAPNFKLRDENNKPHELSEMKGGVVLLAFYPADFTRGCTIEAHCLTASNADFISRGVTVYGVSVQDSSSHSKFCHTEGIPYTLLADTKHKVSAMYSGLMPVIGLAKRVTFIIDKQGKIVYIDKDVNGHINTCAKDWLTWLDAHPEVTK